MNCIYNYISHTVFDQNATGVGESFSRQSMFSRAKYDIPQHNITTCAVKKTCRPSISLAQAVTLETESCNLIPPRKVFSLVKFVFVFPILPHTFVTCGALERLQDGNPVHQVEQ